MCCQGETEPAEIPPAERAAFFHGLRVHAQIIQWRVLVNEKNARRLKPEDWGWRITADNNIDTN